MVPSTRCYIALGSNLERPIEQIEEALAAIARVPELTLLAYSRLYRSRPMGPADQPDYVNAVAMIETALTPLELLDELQAQEARQGRVRGEVRWGPRTLDLDLLLYGDHIIRTVRLTVPHPGMGERNFVLHPLHELSPDLVLPDGTRLSELVKACPADGLERLGGRET